MNLIQTNRLAPDMGRPPPDPSVLNIWAVALMGAVFIALCAFMAGLFSHFAIEKMGLDAARIAVGQVTTGASVSAVMAGTGGAVLLTIAGRLRWAVAYAAWLGVGTGVVIGTVVTVLGADVTTAIQQGAMVSIAATLLPAFLYLLVLMTREGVVRPMLLLLDFVSDVLNAIANLTPWGPRWGKVLAVLAAIWLVVGTAAVLLAMR